MDSVERSGQLTIARGYRSNIYKARAVIPTTDKVMANARRCFEVVGPKEARERVKRREQRVVAGQTDDRGIAVSCSGG